MIEKLDIPESTVIDPSVLWGGINDNVLAAKINEVIDAVNELWTQVAILQEHAHPTATTEPADQYAEQRWVGCLCKLWTGDGLVRYGILRGIALNRKKTNYPYQALSTSFEHCEPVKPDDDIIYKGE